MDEIRMIDAVAAGEPGSRLVHEARGVSGLRIAFGVPGTGECWGSLLLFWLLLLWGAGPLYSLGTGKPLRAFGQRAWQSDNGLPQNTVRALVQTRDGFLWIGTEAGLVRFDGMEFRVFDTGNTPALHSGIIHALAEDRDGSLWIATATGLARERDSSFSAYGLAQGLPSEAVLALHVTHGGRLLALTAGGAAVLEGARFHLLAGTERLGMTEGASLIAEGAKGQVWIGGPSSLLGFSAELAPLTPGGLVTPGREAEAPGGGANQGSSPGSRPALSPALIVIPRLGELQTLAMDTDGALWVGGASGLAVVAPSGAIAAPPGIEGAKSANVTSLLADGQGGMWVGTSRGLQFVSHGTAHALPSLAGVGVENLALDRAGTLWVATIRGMARVIAVARNGDARASGEPAEFTVDLEERRPALTGVLAILEDREGSMWFGTDASGLHVLRDQAFATISVEDGLASSLVRAVFEDHSGTMWVGTGAGLDRITSGKVSAYTGGLPSRAVLALAETCSGASCGQTSPPAAGGVRRYTMWVGTPAGLVKIQSGRSRVYTTADGLSDDFVRSLYADRDGSLWVGTRNGLTHWKDGALRSYSRLDGLPSDLIGAMLRARDGSFWVGSLGGLSRMEGDGFARVAVQAGGEGSGGEAVTALLEDHAGGLWVGIQGGGLHRLRSGKLQALSPKVESGVPASSGTGGNVAGELEQELPETIFGMLEDKEENLWLSSRSGIDRVSIAGLEAFGSGNAKLPAIAHYGMADGMRIREASGGGHPAAWEAGDGGLWFATLDGVAVVHPVADGLGVQGRDGRDATPGAGRGPTPSAIEQVLVEEEPVAEDLYAPGRSENAQIRVPPGHGRLTIRYAGLSFVAPQKVRYRYRLEGFDRGWINAGARRTAFYTNVPPGSYRFLVLAADGDGVWSTHPAEVRFLVEPYFYQTWWFYALAALSLAGLGYLAYRWRVHSVEAQYQAVSEERGRIAREIHDTLAQGYVAVSVQLELAERLLTHSVEAARQQLQQTRVLVREGLEEARSSIWNLRAQTDAETLPSQVASYIGALTRRVGPEGAAAPTLRFAVHGAYRPLARSVEAEVRRVAQEAVANAVNHARAGLIMVTLTYDAQVLELRVADDGRGLPAAAEQAAAERGHFGLRGMRERAAKIGAVLEIGAPEKAGAAEGSDEKFESGAAPARRIGSERTGASHLRSESRTVSGTLVTLRVDLRESTKAAPPRG